MPKYNFYSDPGHGWLRVPLQDIMDLDLVDKITKYSYMNATGSNIYVYLEEDLDAQSFMDAHYIRRLYPAQVNYMEPATRRSHIRSLPSYDAGFIKWIYMGITLAELRA